MMPAGRPTKFNPERSAAIIESISKAIPYEMAAMSNGIRESTLYEWIKKGWNDLDEGIDSDWAKFSEAIKKVEAERIERHSTKISENVDRWQADAWMLERRWYRHYGSNVHLHELEDRMKEIEGRNGKKDESHADQAKEARSKTKETEI